MFRNGVRIFMMKLFTVLIVYSEVVDGATKKEVLWRQLEEEVILFHSKLTIWDLEL